MTPPAPYTILEVSRALLAATHRHPGFDWSTSEHPLPNGRFQVDTENTPHLYLDPRMGGDTAFDAVMDGIGELDGVVPYASVTRLPERGAARGGQTG